MLGVLVATVLSPIVVLAGSSQQLATTLSLQLDAPVVVMVDPARRKWPSLRIDRDRLTPKDVDRLLATKLGSAAFPAGTYGIASRAWPEYFRSLPNRGIYDREAKEVAGIGKLKWRKVDGMVAAETVNGAVPVQDVLAKFDPPVRCHRFFLGAHIVLDTPVCSPSRLLKTIAAAIGARVGSDGKISRLEIDIASYRTRTLADLLRESELKQAVMSADARFGYMALQLVPDDILAKSLAEDAPREPIRWETPPVELRVEANRNLWVTMTQTRGVSEGEAQIARWSRDFDLARPIILVGLGGFGIAYPHRRTPGAYLNIL